MNRKLIARQLCILAKNVLAEESNYVYDPDHKHKPKGGHWEKTEKGWSQKKEEVVLENKEQNLFSEKCKSTNRDDFDEVFENLDKVSKDSIQDLIQTVKKVIKKPWHRDQYYKEIVDTGNLSESVCDTLSKLNPDDHPETLKALAGSSAITEKAAKNLFEKGIATEILAANPSTPKDILKQCANHYATDVKQSAAGNPNTPQEDLVKLAEKCLQTKQTGLGYATQGRDAVTEKLSMSLIENPSLPTETLEKFSKDTDPHKKKVTTKAQEELQKRKSIENAPIDLSKLSPELREQVKDMDPEELKKFIGWLRRRKEGEA